VLRDYSVTVRNSSQSITIFKAQEKVIRVMMGCRNRNSFRNLFKIRVINILPLKSQYILTLLVLVVNYKNYFTINAGDYNILTTKK
jgi:hypothetical protein